MSDKTTEQSVTATKNRTEATRKSDVEVVITRTVDAPARLVFEAWTTADLFRQWWVPKSYGLNLVSCELDVRVGGKYRLVFLHDGAEMAFFGTYLEVVTDSRLVWTNEEDPGGQTVTTVTFEESAGKTLVTILDLYPSADAVNTGSSGAMPEVLDQLDALLASHGGSSAVLP